MKPIVIFIAVIAFCSPALARPLLSDSQTSHAAVCLDQSEPYERLAAICEAALGDAGVSHRDIIEMKVILAGAYEELGKPEQALALVEEVLSENPEHTGALNVKGWSFWSAADYDRAHATFRASIASGATAQGFAGAAAAGYYGDLIDREEFLTLIDTALALSPQYLWAMREKGWFFIYNDRPQEAEATFEQAMGLDSENPFTLYGLGAALYDQDRFAAALARLNRAVDTGQAPVDAVLLRAKANFEVGNFKRTIIDADDVIEVAPHKADAHIWKARAHDALGLTPRAIRDLRKVVAEGHHGRTSYWLAHILLYDDQAEAAVAALRAVFEAEGTDYFDHELMALILVETGNFEEAELHIEAALSLDPEAAFPRYYRSLIKAHSGAFDAAEQLMVDALQNGLPTDEIRHFLGALTEQGEFVRAIAFRIKANEIVAERE